MRVINGYAVCAGDCPMFQATGKALRGHCALENRSCRVGQLCYVPVVTGGKRYPFGRFGSGKKYRIGPMAPRPRTLKAA
jgi:hypothetical protein